MLCFVIFFVSLQIFLIDNVCPPLDTLRIILESFVGYWTSPFLIIERCPVFQELQDHICNRFLSSWFRSAASGFPGKVGFSQKILHSHSFDNAPYSKSRTSLCEVRLNLSPQFLEVTPFSGQIIEIEPLVSCRIYSPFLTFWSCLPPNNVVHRHICLQRRRISWFCVRSCGRSFL